MKLNRNKSYGLLELISGILMVALGLYSFGRAESTVTTLVTLYAIMAIVTGVTDILFYVRTERYVGFAPVLSLISGICSAMTGVMLLLYPNAGHFIISLMLPIWFIAHSIFNLANLSMMKFLSSRGLYYCTMVANIFGLILGIVLLINPSWTIVAIGTYVAVYLILMGLENVCNGIYEMKG